jgi:hypothetical protein
MNLIVIVGLVACGLAVVGVLALFRAAGLADEQAERIFRGRRP